MLRPLLTLLSGGAFRQIATVAALPVLARLYDAEAFGQLGAIMAMVSLTAVIVHGRYHLALPVARSEAEASALLRLAQRSSLLLSLPAIGLVWLAFGESVDFITTLAIAGLLTFATATADIFAYWRSRTQMFALSARIDAARAIVTLTAQFAWAPFGAMGLLFGTLSGTILAAILGRWTCRPEKSDVELCEVARRYNAYPIFGVPQGWLASASHNLLPLLLLKFGTIALMGQYWLAYRLLLTPVGLVNHAYRQAVLPRLRDGITHENREACRQHTTALLALGLVPCSLLVLHGEALFAFGLGAGWAQAGAIAGWLSCAVLADAFKIPALTMLQAAGRQRTILVWEIAIVTLRYAIALPLLMAGEPMNAIAAYACTGFACWSTFCITHLRRRKAVAHA